MREDRETTTVEDAARYERDRAEAAGEDDRPTRAELEDPPDECPSCGEPLPGEECEECGWPSI